MILKKEKPNLFRSPVESPSALSPSTVSAGPNCSGPKGLYIERLDVGIWDLFGIWCLEFVILVPYQGKQIGSNGQLTTINGYYQKLQMPV